MKPEQALKEGGGSTVMFVIFRQRHLIKRAAHKVQQALPAPTASLPLSLLLSLSLCLSVPLALNLSHIPHSLRLPLYRADLPH